LMLAAMMVYVFSEVFGRHPGGRVCRYRPDVC
jgi:hypothetical protein